ncbi:MAG: hypothetical protein J6C44_00910 [Muribaculaceae bacterium]|nr:hypothetical protein [Muribaculaceae bacterium]
MKTRIFVITLLFSAIAGNIMAEDGEIKGSFDWSNPGTLTPAYNAPDADNRSGDYVGNVDFTDNGVTFTVIDNDVKEKSQSARFYYGYNTGACELRIYVNSDIVIKAPAGMTVKSVQFFGPEVGPDYLDLYNQGNWDGMTFNVTEPSATEVKFYAPARVELSTTTVTCSTLNGVTDIIQDVDTNAPAKYYDLQGRQVNASHLSPGLYIKRQGACCEKMLIGR